MKKIILDFDNKGKCIRKEEQYKNISLISYGMFYFKNPKTIVKISILKWRGSKIDECPFCQQQATTLTKQGITVCNKHKDSILNEMKCFCGQWLELKKGRYGFYFNCLGCGNINKKKVFEINEVKDMK